jgi:hypothetical protein
MDGISEGQTNMNGNLPRRYVNSFGCVKLPLYAAISTIK